MSRKNSAVGGAAILAAAGIIVKLLGFAFRIPLTRWIGASGMADYTPAYDVYSLLLIVATSGIPVAISKLVSERCAVGEYKEAGRVFHIARLLMWGIGITGFLILWFFADPIAKAIGIQTSALSMKATAPALLFVPIMSSYRGFFQGLQIMQPTALSQIAEQIARVIVGLGAAYLLFKGMILPNSLNEGYTGIEALRLKGAAGACLGASAGALAGFLVMIWIRFMYRHILTRKAAKDHSTVHESGKKILKRIIWIAFPITLAACIMPIVNLIDVAIVQNRLTGMGYSYEAAKNLYGQLTSMAAPIISFPLVLIQALTATIVPMVSRSWKLKNHDLLERDCIFGFRASQLISLPCIVGMIVIAQPILILFYGDQARRAPAAASCLQIYAISFFFLSLVSIATSMLQGLGKQHIPVINLFIGIALKICITWTLTGIHAINVRGAAIGTTCSYCLASILDIIALKRITGVKLELVRSLGKPLIASLVMGAAVLGTNFVMYKLTSSLYLNTIVDILVGMIVYGFMTLAVHALSEEEIAHMPHGDKIQRIVDKFTKRK